MEEIHLITHVDTTTATVHEAQRTADIHQALADKSLLPQQHFVDAAYVDGELLVDSLKDHGIALIGPTRANSSWQARTEGAYTLDQFEIDWQRQQVRCPQGRLSRPWKSDTYGDQTPHIHARFRPKDCHACAARELCTRGKSRQLKIQPYEQYQAVQASRHLFSTEEGKSLYNRRAGIEGTISQGVRAFGLRFCRYRGLAKTHLQNIATAAAINIDRIFAWLNETPQAQTRQSAFAKLAPIQV